MVYKVGFLGENNMEQKSQNKSSTKLEQTRQQGIKTLAVLFVVGVAVFLGFSPLFELVKGGVAGQVIGSTFGAIFAILMTMFLLNKQTEIEQESKKSERVFDEKVVLYKDILERSKIMLEDGRIDSKEFLALPFTMIKMQMVGGDEAIRIYTEFFEKINEIYEADENDAVQIPEPQVQQVFSLLSRFSVQCRVDLGISDTPIDKSIFARTISAVEHSSEAVKGKRDISKYTFNGEALGKSRLVLAVIKDYVGKNPNTAFDGLKKAFPDEWQGKGRNRAVFVRLIEAEKVFNDTGHRRHFFKINETIQLSDEVIAVSNQWGIGNIGDFIDGSNQNHNAGISK
jgi:hypothetical protein|tara:strand:- start:246 stop:1268 length:1023 start_codon:yes stop_codon:yes gene_type:complete